MIRAEVLSDHLAPYLVDPDPLSEWISAIVHDDCIVDVYVIPDHALTNRRKDAQTGKITATLSEEQKQTLVHGSEEQKQALVPGAELVFQARCMNGCEAEKAARGIVKVITEPGLIGFELDDIRELAADGSRRAKLWLFESFDDEPLEEFKGRIKAVLPTLASRRFLLQNEGDIGASDYIELSELIEDLSSKEAQIFIVAQFNEGTPGYKALYIFSFED